MLERLFPGIGQLDQALPGAGFDGPSLGESVDEGADNLDAAIRKGGRGVAIGLSEGCLVLDAEQARLANDPTAPPRDQLSFATFGDPIARTPWGQSFLTTMFPVGGVAPATRLPHTASVREPIRHQGFRLRLRLDRRLPRPAG